VQNASAIDLVCGNCCTDKAKLREQYNNCEEQLDKSNIWGITAAVVAAATSITTIVLGTLYYAQGQQIKELKRDNLHLLRRDFNKNVGYRD
jgi:hypothetical protein